MGSLKKMPAHSVQTFGQLQLTYKYTDMYIYLFTRLLGRFPSFHEKTKVLLIRYVHFTFFLFLLLVFGFNRRKGKIITFFTFYQ